MASIHGQRARPLRLAPGVRDGLVRLARGAAPDEGCGVLLGRPGDVRDAGDTATDARPALNRAAAGGRDPRSHYELCPAAWLRAEDEAAARGLRVLGFWHSHPTGPAAASAEDAASALEGFTYVIVGLGGATPELRAWRLDAGRLGEVPLAPGSDARHLGRPNHAERGALPGLRIDAQLAAVQLDDALDDREP